jgi:hypothetical protein
MKRLNKFLVNLIRTRMSGFTLHASSDVKLARYVWITHTTQISP